MHGFFISIYILPMTGSRISHYLQTLLFLEVITPIISSACDACYQQTKKYPLLNTYEYLLEMSNN